MCKRNSSCHLAQLSPHVGPSCEAWTSRNTFQISHSHWWNSWSLTVLALKLSFAFALTCKIAFNLLKHFAHTKIHHLLQSGYAALLLPVHNKLTTHLSHQHYCVAYQYSFILQIIKVKYVCNLHNWYLIAPLDIIYKHLLSCSYFTRHSCLMAMS